MVSGYDPAAIGERIAEARLRQDGMSQSDLARAVGVGPRSIQHYEAGDSIPWRVIRKIAAATDVDVEWLLKGDKGVEREPTLEELQAQLAELTALVRKMQEQPQAAPATPEDRAGSAR